MQVRVDQAEHIDLHVFKDLQGHVQLQPELVPGVMDGGGWIPVQKATPQIQYIADQVGIRIFISPHTVFHALQCMAPTSCR